MNITGIHHVSPQQDDKYHLVTALAVYRVTGQLLLCISKCKMKVSQIFHVNIGEKLILDTNIREKELRLWIQNIGDTMMRNPKLKIEQTL
jgi:hypothetical protein